MTTQPPVPTRDRLGLRLLRLFFAASPVRPLAVLLALLLAGAADALGVATLLPVLNLAIEGDGQGDSFAQRAAVDAITAVGLPLELGPLLAVLVAALLVKAGFVLLAMNYVGGAAASVATSLRERLVGALLDARWSYFHRQPSAHLSAAVSSEASRASQAYLDVAATITNGLQVLIYLGLCILVSWRLSLLAAALGLTMSLLLGRLVRLARRAGGRQTERTRRLVRLLDDILATAKPLKAMARTGDLGALYRVEARRLHRSLRHQVLTRQALRSLQEPVIALFLGGTLFAALRLGEATPAELMVTALLLFRTVRAIGRTQEAYQAASVSESAYRAICEAIAEAEAAREPCGGGVPPSLERGCVFAGVDFAYPGAPVLRALDLSLPAGSLVALSGPSGSGKSTLVDLLLGLHEPQAGSLTVDGVPLDRLDLTAWRRMIGYVPQDVILFNDSILQNLALGDPAADEAAAWAALRMASADFVAALPQGLHTPVGERGALLSGGQRQRLALARALLHRPRLLILDEATSALDPESEAAVCRAVHALTRQEGLTVLAITHRPAWLHWADRAYHLADGRLAALPRLAAG